ncbi:MAG: hypothetical protein JEZ12_28315 [Desulfobacterium sp.]|nr:hypothetical protein [Desulfobacterium sp.]
MKDDNVLMEFPKNKRYEFIYFPILFALLLILKLSNIGLANDNFASFLFIILGLLHILANNVLAYMYNLSYVAILIPLRVKPWFIKIFGMILILNSIRVLFKY